MRYALSDQARDRGEPFCGMSADASWVIFLFRQNSRTPLSRPKQLQPLDLSWLSPCTVIHEISVPFSSATRATTRFIVGAGDDVNEATAVSVVVRWGRRPEALVRPTGKSFPRPEVHRGTPQHTR